VAAGGWLPPLECPGAQPAGPTSSVVAAIQLSQNQTVHPTCGLPSSDPLEVEASPALAGGAEGQLLLWGPPQAVQPQGPGVGGTSHRTLADDCLEAWCCPDTRTAAADARRRLAGAAAAAAAAAAGRGGGGDVVCWVSLLPAVGWYCPRAVARLSGPQLLLRCHEASAGAVLIGVAAGHAAAAWSRTAGASEPQRESGSPGHVHGCRAAVGLFQVMRLQGCSLDAGACCCCCCCCCCCNQSRDCHFLQAGCCQWR